MLDSPFTRIPLWRDDPDNVIGVLHVKALLRAIRHKGDQLEGLDPVAISVKPWFIPDTTNLLDQLQAFRARREHFSLVVDEYGSLQGVVTLEDILEEIVGDISDEHDIPVAGVRPQANGSFIVDGTVTIRDLNRQFEWDLPDEEASTIAGLVLHEARRIPEVGQTFTFFRLPLRDPAPPPQPDHRPARHPAGARGGRGGVTSATGRHWRRSECPLRPRPSASRCTPARSNAAATGGATGCGTSKAI